MCIYTHIYIYIHIYICTHYRQPGSQPGQAGRLPLADGAEGRADTAI